MDEQNEWYIADFALVMSYEFAPPPSPPRQSSCV